MTGERVLELKRVATRALARFQQDADWEDVLQEGWIAAWLQCERLEGKAAWTTVAWNAARWQVREYHRLPRSRIKVGKVRPGQGDAPVPRILSLEELRCQWEDGGDADGREPAALDPGYAAVEEELDSAALWGAIKDACTGRQWQAIRLRYVENLTVPEVGRRLGVSKNTARDHISGGLNAYRRRVGARERPCS